jgi:hypothetical protein
MAKIKYDGVLEAAHYKSDGQIDWVRVYIRRGPIFSDRILLSRAAFIEQLKAGKRYMVGERIFNMGGKFNVSKPVRVQQKDGTPVIVVGDAQAKQDELTGVPII